MTDPITTMNAENIHIGAGNIFLKGTEACAEYQDLGYCRGFSLDASTKLLTIEADQSLYPIEQKIVGINMKGSVELLEMTMENLVRAFGGDPADIVEDNVSTPNTSTYTFKASMASPPEFEMLYVVARPKDETKKLRFTLYKIQSSGGLKLKFVKDKENSFNFEFVALAKEVDAEMLVGVLVMDKYDA